MRETLEDILPTDEEMKKPQAISMEFAVHANTSFNCDGLDAMGLYFRPQKKPGVKLRYVCNASASHLVIWVGPPTSPNDIVVMDEVKLTKFVYGNNDGFRTENRGVWVLLGEGRLASMHDGFALKELNGSVRIDGRNVLFTDLFSKSLWLLREDTKPTD